MSYTELYKVPKTGPLELYAEFHNAYRGAMLVWMNLGEHYLGEFNIMNLTPVWNLAKDFHLPLSHRIVLLATFDNVMIRKENLPRFVQAVDDYSKQFDPGTLPEQCFKLGELVVDPTCYAVCWNQTSVNCDAWEVERETDVDGEPLYEMYDVSHDSDHWFLFDEEQFS